MSIQYIKIYQPLRGLTGPAGPESSGQVILATDAATAAEAARDAAIVAKDTAVAAADGIVIDVDAIAANRIATNADVVTSGNNATSSTSSANTASASASTAVAAADLALVYATNISHALVFKGDWDASTGAPPTPVGDPNEFADVYRITVSGTINTTLYSVGDMIIWDALKDLWFKGSGSGAGGGDGIGEAPIDGTPYVRQDAGWSVLVVPDGVNTATQTALNGKVDDGQVLTNVPLGAVFTDTDTVYSHPATHTLSQISDAGTSASKDVAITGDASATEVVLGNDTRLVALSASGILTSIKTVDGTGSGLDADLLDGNEATYFAPQVTTYSKVETDNLITGVISDRDWKEAVTSFADLATTYTSPVEGWAASVNDEDTIYRYDGSAWIAISGGTVPLATGAIDGKLASSDFTKIQGIEVGATADQTASEIKSLYESGADTNAFTDSNLSKLSGIESGATADMSAAELLTAIKTVDGSGSGLDADTLDGHDTAYFALAATTDTSAEVDAKIAAGNGALILLETINISGSPTEIDIQLPVGYSSYHIDLIAVKATSVITSGTMFRTSIDGGTTFATTGYDYARSYNSSIGNGVLVSPAVNNNAFFLAWAQDTISGRIDLYDPRAVAVSPAKWSVIGVEPTSVQSGEGAGIKNTVESVNAISLLYQSGSTFASGKIRVFGVA